MKTAIPRFSICVPTYNRGAKALNMITTLLPEIDSDWELLVLDNASDYEHTEYPMISDLAEQHSNLRYFRHEFNGMFHGNYVACFEMALAPYIMVVSDEDFANPEMIRNAIKALDTSTNLGVYRGSMAPMPGVHPRNSHTRPNQAFEAGANALVGFSFTNNYMSGTIYNRALAERYGLIARLRNNMEQQRVYPHLYMELLMAAVCDVTTTSEVACYEGHEQITTGGDPLLGVSHGPLWYNPPYSFGSRVDQFIVLRDGLREAVSLIEGEYNHTLFVNLYLRLCEKYFHLISNVNSPLYKRYVMNLPLLQESFLYICGAAISLYPELSGADTQIFEAIQKIYLRYASNNR